MATIGLSVLCHRFIEVPLRIRLRGNRPEDSANIAGPQDPRQAVLAAPRYTPP